MTKPLDPWAARMAELKLLPTAVYRYFGESDDLIYVGMSHDPVMRRMQHLSGERRWFKLVRREHVTWYGSRAAAFRAESLAIRTESPLVNGGGYRPAAEPDRLAPYQRGRLSRKRELEKRAIVAEIRAEERRMLALARNLPSTSCWAEPCGMPDPPESLLRSDVVSWLRQRAAHHAAFGPKTASSLSRFLSELADDLAAGLEAA